MREITISHLAYALKRAKEQKFPQPIFFLGAGASRTGKIPLAGEIVKQILHDYADSPFLKDLHESERTYAKLMGCLSPDDRDELLKKYIDDAKINVTHMYLAQFLKEGFVDYVLTVNFDNLMLRALALFNIFPSTFDMAILKDFTTTAFKEKSVVYLHGQSHGLWLLNTPEELEKVKNTVPRIFDTIKNRRPWIFIGYSGEDPIFEYVKNLGRFNNGLYWVAYNDNLPGAKIQKFLSDPNTNAFLIKGFDSDSFMLKLNSELGLGQPYVVDKPFTALKRLLLEIVDIDEKEHFKGVKERLDISKRQVDEAIQHYEDGKVESREHLKARSEVDLLKKEIINLQISKNYDADVISDIEKRAQGISDTQLLSLLSDLFTAWGKYLVGLSKKGNDSANYYLQAVEKYQRAVDIKQDNHEAYFNWGITLMSLAETMDGKDSEQLYKQAIEKFRRVIEIEPSLPEAYSNWGVCLGMCAKDKEATEAEQLYMKAFEKFQKAVDLDQFNNQPYNVWGVYLANLAQIKEGEEAEELYRKSFEKFDTATEMQDNSHEAFNDWGGILFELAQTKRGEEAEQLYMQAIEKFQKAIEIMPDFQEAYTNWGLVLGVLALIKDGNEAEKNFFQAFDKFQKASEIMPDSHEAYYNWGIHLGNLAMTKEGKEAEKYYSQAYNKFQKAIEIKPNFHETYYNLGICLANLAKIKKEKEAEQHYIQAFEKYQKAVELKPDFYKVYNKWGVDLGNLAKIKKGKATEQYYLEAFEKYQKAVELKPDLHDAYYNWGNVLMDYANIMEGKESEVLFNKALEVLQKGVAFGGKKYNLACWYALHANKAESLPLLEKSLEDKEIKSEYVEVDKDWEKLKMDKDFIALITKYKTI